MTLDALKIAMREWYDEQADPMEAIGILRAFIAETLSPFHAAPVDHVQWIPIEQVQSNDYNPNAVASAEMMLLHTSIDHDGYTQPVVCVYDSGLDKYVIIDGFHRFSILKTYPAIAERTHSCLPCVVLDKAMNDRMASTIRHNRARGKHSIAGMSNLVFSMLDNGWKDEAVCNELGMEPEELLRLKHVTGFSKLFEDAEYRKAWDSRRQLQLRKEQAHD